MQRPLCGEETLHALRRLRPDLPVLVSSGYDADQAAPGLRDTPSVGFLKKR